MQQTLSIKKELYRITSPIFIDIALVMLLGAVDTIMLSRYSDDAVAAVGLDNQLMSLVFLVYQFVSMGAAILCAQYFGAKLRSRFIQIVGIAVLLNTVVGLAVSSILFIWAGPILHAFGLRDGLMPDGVAYLRITGALSFFQALSLTFSATLRSTGKTMLPMLSTVVVNILNILGDYALIFGNFGCPALGVEGAAWATAGCRIVNMLILLSFIPKAWPSGVVEEGYGKVKRYVVARTRIVTRGVNYFRPFPWRELRNLFKIGIPAMSEEMSYSLSQITITYFINMLGTEVLATKVYCWTIITFVILLSVSIVQGGDILVGHFVGKLRYRAAYILGNYVLKTSMIATMIAATILAVFGSKILSFFTDNPEIIRIGTYIFIIDWFLDIGRVRNIFAGGTLRTAGDVVYPLVVGVIFQWSVAVGFAWFLGIPCGFGLIGFWVAFCLDENIRGVVLMRRWHSQKWRNKAFTKPNAE